MSKASALWFVSGWSFLSVPMGHRFTSDHSSGGSHRLLQRTSEGSSEGVQIFFEFRFRGTKSLKVGNTLTDWLKREISWRPNEKVQKKGSCRSIHQEKRKRHQFRNHNRVVIPAEEGEINGAGEWELQKGGGGVHTLTSYCSKDSGWSISDVSRAPEC